MTKQNKNRISPISVGLKQSILPLTPSADERLDIAALETWLWDAACAIRGATDAPKFKDFILPLIFYKRLSDVFDDEFAGHVTLYGDEQVAREIIEADHDEYVLARLHRLLLCHRRHLDPARLCRRGGRAAGV